MPTEAQVYLQQVYCCYYFLRRQAEKLWAADRTAWDKLNDNTGERHKDLRELLGAFSNAAGNKFTEDETEHARRVTLRLTDATIAKLAVRSPYLCAFGPLGTVEQSLRGPVDMLGRTQFKRRSDYIESGIGRRRRLPRVTR